ncbi:hypothetical protein [Collinsella stercoris]|uniref:Lipoprotein n=1 Tax=Collinsella stercoris DSM 13279 TaxID=445975 RepID=B6GDJ6_9ACTN|nr:hypothetical protein [Collinsella stercoris]EEA89635.1 hypothetical protein COLSTE_02177 [Collinsella stercoris DSM 13279]UEA45184.1 hypothetical protein LK434_08630 [Collinsella stercoris DSM 13279]UWP12291.1 hypothetical protein NQ498_03400 [Collinsella stercoris]
MDNDVKQGVISCSLICAASIFVIAACISVGIFFGVGFGFALFMLLFTIRLVSAFKKAQ